MDNKTKDALKQLQAEIRQLQTIVAAQRTEPRERTETKEGVIAEDAPRKAKDALVQCSVTHAVFGAGSEPKKMVSSASAAQLERVTNEAAAALGYALASPQKIGLLRALLNKNAETASALGAQTGLSTGSLYHHLRELMRSGLVHQDGRNSYVLTERGTQVLLILLTLAIE